MRHFCTFLSAIVLAAASAAQNTPDVLYFKMNDNLSSTTGANDAYPTNSIVGTLGAGASFSTFSRVGSGSLLALAATAARMDTTSLSYSGCFTIEFWTYQIPLPPSSPTRYMFGDAQGGANDFRCVRGGPAGAEGMMLRGTGINDVLLPSVPASAWHHVAYVYDSAANLITGYVDGVAVVYVPQPAAGVSLASILSSLAIGGYAGAQSADAFIDEFRFWSQARSAGDIQANMDVEFGPPDVNLSINGVHPSPFLGGRVSIDSPYEVTLRINGDHTSQPFILLVGHTIECGHLQVPWGGSIDVTNPQVLGDGISGASSFDGLCHTDFELTVTAPPAAAGLNGPAMQAVVQDSMNPPFFLTNTGAGMPSFASNTHSLYDSMSDDDFVAHTLAGNQSIEFYGQTYTTLYISSNGLITFNNGSNDFTPDTTEFFQGVGGAPNPAVAPLWGDYNNPSSDGYVTVSQTGSSTTIAWENQHWWNSGVPAGSFSVTFDSAPGGSPRIAIDTHAVQDRVFGLDPNPILGVSHGAGIGTNSTIDFSTSAPIVTSSVLTSDASYAEQFGGPGMSTHVDFDHITFTEYQVGRWVVSIP